MNLSVTWLAEKLVELGYLIRTSVTPNPFREVKEPNPWWQCSSPDQFYSIPETPPSLFLTPLAEAKGEKLARFQFSSPYTSPHPQNNTVYGLADLRPEGTSRAAIIFLHGHMMTRATLFPLLWYSRQVIRQGFDLYYMNLPYHMRRTPRGCYSGQHSLNSDIEGSALAFMQGVQDVRSLVNWIVQEKHLPVALAGISLGAYTACMTAVVEPRLKAVVSILGGASLARLPWDGYQGGKIRRQLEAGGITLEQLEQYWRLLNPGNFQPILTRDKILMIAGKFDQIVTPANVDQLWRVWNQPEIHWYPCGHVSSALYHRSISPTISTFIEQSLDYT